MGRPHRERAPLPAPFPDAPTRNLRRKRPVATRAPARRRRRGIDSSTGRDHGGAGRPRSRVSAPPSPECPFRPGRRLPAERSHLLGALSLHRPPRSRGHRPVPSSSL